MRSIITLLVLVTATLFAGCNRILPADPKHPEVPAKIVTITNTAVPQFVASICPKASFPGFFQTQALMNQLKPDESQALMDYSKLRLHELTAEEAEHLGLQRVQYAQWRKVYGD